MSSTSLQTDHQTYALVTSEANPFCTRFVRPGVVRYRFATSASEGSTTTHSIIEKIIHARRSAIVGPHGTGKSTLLESMRDTLLESYTHIQWVQLRSSQIVSSRPADNHGPRQATTLNNRQLTFAALQNLQQRHANNPETISLLVVDGFEQLPWLDRWKLTHNANRDGIHLLVTSHRRVRSFATVHCTRVNPKTVRQLTIDLAATGSPQAQRAIHQELAQRDLSQVDNVRDFWFELFDVVADAQSACKGVE